MTYSIVYGCNNDRERWQRGENVNARPNSELFKNEVLKLHSLLPFPSAERLVVSFRAENHVSFNTV